MYVSPQAFADMEAIGSMEESKGELGPGSPVSNLASINAATNPESVGHNADLQVCVSLSFSLSLFWFVLHM